MDFLKAFNISFDIFGILLCTIAIFGCILNRKIDKNISRLYLCLFITIILDVLANMLGIIYRGKEGHNIYVILRFTNFFEYFLGYVYSFIMTKFCIVYFKVKIKHLNLFLGLIYFPCVLMLIISQFNNMYYSINAQNIYVRGPLFFISQLWGLLFLLFNFIIFIRYFKQTKRSAKILFSVYFIFPIIGLLFQLFVYGIYSLLISTVLSALTMYLVMTYEQVNSYVLMEKKAEEAKYHLVLSQVSPHFLYNTLTSIMALCDDNPKAQEALSKFSKYLRNNLDSIKTTDNINILKELEHVNIYLYLEQLRFGDKIKVEYSIENSHFDIPVFTLQIPVENAVKHGISKKVDGGHIFIKTYEDKKNNIIVVYDDGLGFDKDDIDPSREHVGIENLKRRLKEQVNGKLEINSIKGTGTTVKILIPKK